MLAARGLHAFLVDDAGVGDTPCRPGHPVLAVGRDDEGPIAGQLPQHLLAEEEHRDRLADPWVCQNTPSLARSPSACSLAPCASPTLNVEY